ncbi:MAG TPA: hypothetical protein VJ124_08325 [Pyrinomonadaceae bacterium]|nr:hypothetical protein [Pyrinomonadaceae bacterium]
MELRSIDVFPIGKQRHRARWRGGLLLLVLAVAPLGGQTPSQTDEQANPLPATTGEPLTIAPVDLPDIDCSIQEWNPGRPKPLLTLLCPPEAVFAPVRVYLRLSWMRPDDVPSDVARIVARPKRSTKMRTNKSAVMVRLEVSAQTGQHAQTRWVGFNGVVDVALIMDSRRP